MKIKTLKDGLYFGPVHGAVCGWDGWEGWEGWTNSCKKLL